MARSSALLPRATWRSSPQFSGIPTINALTDEEHPCQILADIQTIQEKRGAIAGKVVTFVGDGACNVPVSWMFAAAKLGFELRIAAPKKFQPSAALLKRAGGKIICTADVKAAARGADVLYTDVWVSMGKEAESAARLKALKGYQINQSLVKLAKPGALVMHCLPAYRGKEIDDATFEAHADTIFTQAENRLHVQKAILKWAVELLSNTMTGLPIQKAKSDDQVIKIRCCLCVICVVAITAALRSNYPYGWSHCCIAQIGLALARMDHDGWHLGKLHRKHR